MTTSTPRLDIDGLLKAASVEISSRGHEMKELRAGFAPSADVTITFLPGDNYHHNIETAAKLRGLGYNPVPHIAARGLQSTAALDDFLARARGEADVKRVLLIAGDIAVPRGPYASTLDLCRSGLVERHGIERVTIAGHPEGHPASRPGRDVCRAGRASRLGTRDRHRARHGHPVLLPGRANPRAPRGARGARPAHARSGRPRRPGDAGDLDEVRAALRGSATRSRRCAATSAASAGCSSTKAQTRSWKASPRRRSRRRR